MVRGEQGALKWRHDYLILLAKATSTAESWASRQRHPQRRTTIKISLVAMILACISAEEIRLLRMQRLEQDQVFLILAVAVVILTPLVEYLGTLLMPLH